MQPGDLAQAFDGAAFGGDALASGGNRLGHRPLEDRNQQVVLAAEVEVDGAGGDAGAARDVGDLRVEEAAGGERFDRRAQNGVAFVGLVGAFGEGRRPSRWRSALMNECSFI